jgi:hypothetical protein
VDCREQPRHQVDDEIDRSFDFLQIRLMRRPVLNLITCVLVLMGSTCAARFET